MGITKIVSGMMQIAVLATLVGCTSGSTDETRETSQAITREEAEVEYYADSTYTTQVGYFIKVCGSSSSSMTGTRTRFAIGSRTSPCPDGPTVGCYQYFNNTRTCSYSTCVDC